MNSFFKKHDLYLLNKIIIIAFTFVFINSRIAFCNSAAPVDLYKEVSASILQNDYDKAGEIIENFIGKNKEEPYGYLLKALLIHYISLDYEDFSQEKDYFDSLKKCEDYSELKISSDKNDIWADYFSYSSRCLKGLWLVSNGNFFSGIIKSKNGVDGIIKIIEKKPDFYDGYITYGSYLFWKSLSIKKFDWFPTIDDKSDLGIEKVREGIDKGILTGDLSNTVLLEMLIAYDPVHAENLADSLIKKYPMCRLFWWQLGDACKKQKKYDKCVFIYTHIAESLRSDLRDDGSGVLRCRWKLASLAKEAGRKDDCLKYCSEVVKLGDKKSVYKRNEKRIEKAKKIIEEITNGK